MNELTKLKREKALEIQRTRGEKKRDEREERNVPGAWMRGEERKNESTKEGERRIEGWWRPRPGRYDHYHHHHRHLHHDEYDAGQNGTWSLRECMYQYIVGSSRFFFLTLHLSLSFAPSRRTHLLIFFHPSRSRRSAILRENVPLRGWVDFLTMTLARTYCLS